MTTLRWKSSFCGFLLLLHTIPHFPFCCLGLKVPSSHCPGLCVRISTSWSRLLVWVLHLLVLMCIPHWTVLWPKALLTLWPEVLKTLTPWVPFLFPTSWLWECFSCSSTSHYFPLNWAFFRGLPSHPCWQSKDTFVSLLRWTSFMKAFSLVKTDISVFLVSAWHSLLFVYSCVAVPLCPLSPVWAVAWPLLCLLCFSLLLLPLENPSLLVISTNTSAQDSSPFMQKWCPHS